MSFSSDVKAELLTNVKGTEAVHCKIAQLLAVVNICGFVSTESYDKFIAIHNENSEIINLTASLIENLFNTEISCNKTEIVIRNEDLIDNMISLLGLRDSNDFSGITPIKYGIAERNCCKRAYIRGAFLAAGSISDPEKMYHLEFACSNETYSEDLKNLINSFGLDAKIVKRKEHYIVYIKEGEQIVDLLNIMGAHKALLDLENIRIIKDMRNNVNRKVNCETANLNKTVNAAVRQIEDIELILERMDLSQLPQSLSDMAHLRLEYPDSSLKELGQLLNPPVGKSGVNHRLRKLAEIADSLREEMGEEVGTQND